MTPSLIAPGRVTLFFLSALYGSSLSLAAATPDPALPRLEVKGGRGALIVDGAPYLILGAQVNNSSAWPDFLAKVWPAMEYLHVNTVEIPVYWEQIETAPGKFDFTVVDTLLAQARERNLRLVLLWFGTWKNGSAHYVPEWIKRDPAKYPNIVGKDGKEVDSPSPFSQPMLEGDTRAFTALMSHLKTADTRHTVIMVQVENEPGAWNSIRDYSPAAQKIFEAAVPAELLTALGKTATGTPPNWETAFGEDAGEYFHAWSVARFIGQVAAAGKAVYPLPLYTNAALRDPLSQDRAPKYESGGPTDNVLPIWKAAAPALDLLAPDIYLAESPKYFEVLNRYSGPGNVLFIPETGSGRPFARYFFAALGHGAIGFSPFGLDYTRHVNEPLGATAVTEERLAPFALNYRIVGPMAREVARWNFEGRLRGVSEADDKRPQTLDFGTWQVTVGFGTSPRGSQAEIPQGNPQPIGGALIAQLSENEFVVTGVFCRVVFKPAGAAEGKPWHFIRVEEGQYVHGVFRRSRIWNGDQTDWGLNFSSVPEVLKVTVYTR